MTVSPRLQGGDERAGDVGQEPRPVGGAVREVDRTGAACAQRGRDGGGLVVAVRDGDAAALAAHCSSVAPLHVGGGCRLVDEHEPVGIKLELAVEPGLPDPSLTSGRSCSLA